MWGSCTIPEIPWRWTAGTCPKMEVWFRSFSLNKMGDGCRFQPLIFHGVFVWTSSCCSLLPSRCRSSSIIYTSLSLFFVFWKDMTTSNVSAWILEGFPGFTNPSRRKPGGLDLKSLRDASMMILLPLGGKKFKLIHPGKGSPSTEKNQLPREDMWKLRVVNKHHQYSCCGQKHVFTYVVGGRVGMNDACYFTFDMKKLDYTPPPPPKV